MNQQTLERFDRLAQDDPVVAPLARLHAETMKAASDSVWEESVPAFDRQQVMDGLPILHRQQVEVDPRSLVRLLSRLAKIAARSDTNGAQAIDDVVRNDILDPVVLLEATVRCDTERLKQLADEVGVEVGPLVTLGQLSALPLLQACGRKAAPLLEQLTWDCGYCPVCAGWTTLAERRGLEKQRWLHCHRCGSAWRFFQQGCPFCMNKDYRSLGYLASNEEKESKRAAVCEVCRGYLKTVTTLSALAPVDVILQDLTTVELDMAAITRKYAHPATSGFSLDFHIVPSMKRKPWFLWQR